MTHTTVTRKYQKKLFLLHHEEQLNSKLESKLTEITAPTNKYLLLSFVPYSLSHDKR